MAAWRHLARTEIGQEMKSVFVVCFVFAPNAPQPCHLVNFLRCIADDRYCTECSEISKNIRSFFISVYHLHPADRLPNRNLLFVIFILLLFKMDFSESSPQVLSIQSHVVAGYVGNKSAVFPLNVSELVLNTSSFSGNKQHFVILHNTGIQCI